MNTSDSVFRSASWIWHEPHPGPDTYGEFFGSFDYNGGSAELCISCDSNYALYVNGALAAFGQYPDYPAYKVYDRLDISAHCASGSNELRIVVWYYGTDNSQTYFKSDAGLIFELYLDGKTVLASGPDTLCRAENHYKNGYLKLITYQLGLSFLYDANAVPGELHGAYPAPERDAKTPRPIERLTLGGRIEAKAEKLGEGHYLVDLGHESCGFIDLEFFSERANRITIAYGEHIADGCVRRKIGSRDFSVEYIAAPGKNVYLNPFRRLGGRYLEIFCEHEITPVYLGLRPTDYPTVTLPFDFGSELRNRIYSVCVDTLRLCMHDHYEDTPWREQALYAMDSRNQMLCGYHAFENADYFRFARASLVMLAKSLRADGLLSICAPTSFDLPIPSFSLIYPVQVFEYIKYSGDRSILDAALPAVRSIFDTLSAHIDETGLIPQLPKPFWNFYEWAYGSDGDMLKPAAPAYDLILNAMFVWSAGYYGELCGMAGIDFASVFGVDLAAMRSRIFDVFYDPERGLLRALHAPNDSTPAYYTKLGNAFAILAGVCHEDTASSIASVLADFDNSTTDSENGLVDTTLSMRAFLYDAILLADPSRGADILADIDRKYAFMLSQGATSFWETIKGESDFDNAGSLCHGWSAIPVYYYRTLIK